jgi:type VI secretion system ImpJ/VasE family protein
MPIQIHWQEGLFLQPHHLQRMQKSLRDEISAERRLAWPYPYGLVEARLSRDELENFRIRFERLRVIMPSGLEIHYPENSELPSLDIKQAFSKGAGTFNLSLGVPLWQNARANTLNGDGQADTRVKLLYRVNEIECTDENTGENPKPIQVRKLNARLMFDHEDPADMELLPLLRIARATGQDVGMPKEDPEYVPPCLVLSGSPVLRELVRDLVSQVEASRKELVVQVSRGGFSIDTMRGVQFEQVMRLRTLNRFSARLPSLVLAPGITPFAMYLELRELLGELAALHPDRDEFESAPYNHENLYLCFRELSNRIRSFLRGAVAPSFLKVEFKDVNGMLSASLSPEQFSQPNAYFLGIKTKLDPTLLARYVEDGDKFKLMPLSLLPRAIRGIELKEERHAPLELPASSDLHYFRLDRSVSARMWQQIEMEKTAAIRWTGNELDWSGTHFTLYMTVPNTAAGK